MTNSFGCVLFFYDIKSMEVSIVRRIIIALILMFAIAPAALLAKTAFSEEERISNMSNGEYMKHIDSINQEKQMRLEEMEESKRLNTKLNEEFKDEMKSYETDFIHLKTSNSRSHAVFTLNNVSSSDVVYIFGEGLPTGKRAILNMKGRGEVGYEMKGLNKSWNKAGSYGVYHYESKELPRINSGDSIRFDNLHSVDVTIFF